LIFFFVFHCLSGKLGPASITFFFDISPSILFQIQNSGKHEIVSNEPDGVLEFCSGTKRQYCQKRKFLLHGTLKTDGPDGTLEFCSGTKRSNTTKESFSCTEP